MDGVWLVVGPNNVIGWIDYAIATLGAGFGGLLAALPLSPLRVSSTVHDGLAAISGMAVWFVPVHEFVVTITALVIAVASWYAVRILLRWLKASASG